MDNKILQNRAQWDSNLNYLLVTIGSVIGLGNIFQFPFFVAKYGSIFIIFYFIFELLISLPIIISELFIGRRGKQNPVGAISLLAMESGANHRWRWIGWLCFIILVLTLGYYCLNVSVYLASLIQELPHLGKMHSSFQGLHPINSAQAFLYFIIFLAMTMFVITRGINRGLETISRIVVPMFFVFFLILAIYASAIGNFQHAVRYLFEANGQLSFELILAALTYAFFKLNTAMGTMIVYGSYLPPTTRIGRSTLIIIAFDLIASLLSYFIIFPLLFSQTRGTAFSNLNLETMLHVFSLIPGGFWFAFFFLLGAIFASWMPAIAFAESATITLIERASLKRLPATLLITTMAIIIGISIIFTTHILPREWSMGEMVQELAGQILTPISALLIAIFAGWVINKDVANMELDFGKKLLALWRFLIRYIVPICIFVVFVYLFWV